MVVFHNLHFAVIFYPIAGVKKRRGWWTSWSRFFQVVCHRHVGATLLEDLMEVENSLMRKTCFNGQRWFHVII